jgi:hypothetical protein
MDVLGLFPHRQLTYPGLPLPSPSWKECGELLEQLQAREKFEKEGWEIPAVEAQDALHLGSQSKPSPFPPDFDKLKKVCAADADAAADADEKLPKRAKKEHADADEKLPKSAKKEDADADEKLPKRANKETLSGVMNLRC